MSELVNKLSNGLHVVEFESRVKDLDDVKNRIENGFVYIKFTQTKGGTELGITVDRSTTNSTDVDFEKGTGTLHLEGTCVLDYQKVRCIADISIATREGKGCLQVEK